MALANCEGCNEIFDKVTGPLCPECIEQDEADLKTVNEALREEANLTVAQLSEKTGVSKKTILRLLKDQRIASDASLAEIKCGKCGAPAISLSIRLCKRCAAEISTTAAQACAKVAQADGRIPSSRKQNDATAPYENETVHETIKRKTGRND
jgi:transcriptional regulator with XRE-family HTH domain